jgi:hypothetical protein
VLQKKHLHLTSTKCIVYIMTNDADEIKSHRDIIRLWGMTVTYGRAIGVSDIAAHMHYRRNSIPSDYWALVVDQAAQIRHAEVTHELLSKLKPVRRRPLADAAIAA